MLHVRLNEESIPLATACHIPLCVQNPSDWLKKQLEIVNIALSVGAVNATEVEEPLLRTSRLQIAALAPVFAIVGNRAAAGQTTAIVDVVLEPVRAVISSQQLCWLRTFAQTVSTVLAARGMPASASA